MNKVKRPIFQMIACFIVGILGGTVYLEHIHLLPLFLLIISLVLAIYIKHYSTKMTSLFLGAFILGALCIIAHPVTQEQKQFIQDEQISANGEVIQISSSPFNDTVTLRKVVVQNGDQSKWIYSKVNVRVAKQSKIALYDKINVVGKVLPRAVQMNPSDMDYNKYLMSQGIVATIKADQYKLLTRQQFNKTLITRPIEEQIDKLYKNQDQGLMKTLLIGDKGSIPDEIFTVYSKTGIGHVLAISGFHIALLITVLHVLLSYLGIAYTPRYIAICSLIWMYAFMTGASTSTIRACIMATFIIIARCIWEEEDLLTNLSLAAGIILFINPFQLFQVGFQLSFVAVASLLMSTYILGKLESVIPKKYLKGCYIFLPWSMVTLATYPVLAAHFYEVPFICSLLNLLLIPVFSVIIILGWSSLLLGIFSLGGGMILARIVVFLLNVVVIIGEKMLSLPLGTLCVGKPGFLSIIIYYSLMSIVFCALIGYIKKEICFYVLVAVMSISLLQQVLVSKTLALTYLYVGQGDSSIIITPNRKIVVVDGGSFGKGRVVEKYIKYKGKKTISAIILSHSDADHIGGLIELLDTDLKVENIFISKSDQSLLLDELMVKCLNKKINIYAVGYLDQFEVDGVQINFLTPWDTQTAEDNNNNSLGCILHYKYFTALFTGDMDKRVEQKMSAGLPLVTVLKVSHHGSKTATSKQTLLNIKPKLAVISCGVNNRYNHPHQQTLETLSKYPIDILRTDVKGAVTISTDGEKVSLDTQIRGD